MKKKRNILALALILPILTSCGDKPSSTTTSGGGSNSTTTAPQNYDFYVRYRGEQVDPGANLSISVNEKTCMLTAIDIFSTSGAKAQVSYASSDASVLAVDTYSGLLTANKEGTADITVTGESSSQVFHFTVSKTTTASGLISYATSSYEDKAEILAALEDYAVDNYLTGITLFSNGGYVAYNSTFKTPAREYISGYGWGTMREGSLSGDLTGKVTHKNYYNSAMTVLPTNSNAMDASGSDVSDIATYYTASYYSNRMTSDKSHSEWYPSLALNLAGNTYPVAIDEETRQPIDSQYNKRWRIYVRCVENESKGNVPVYRTASTYRDGDFNVSSYDKTKVKLEDYLTPFKFMLTGWNQQYRGAEQTEGVSGFAGAFSYFNATANRPSDEPKDAIYDDDLWNQYMGDNIKTGTDENGAYIEFNLLNDCTPFYAMYYLSSSLYSPLPESFVRYWGGDNLGKNRNNEKPVDTMLSVGPYYIQQWDSQLISLKKNDMFFEGTIGTDDNGNTYNEVTLNDGEKSRLYQIPGFDFNGVSSTNTRSYFLDGMLHSYGLQKDDLATTGKFTQDSGFGNNNMKWYRRATKGDSNFKINVNATTTEEWEEKFGPNGTVYAHDRTSDKYTLYHERPKFLSDHDFLDFLSFGLDRKTICELRGMTPTQEYFSDNYLIDPESGISYNSTDAHAAVLADRYNDSDNPGYNETAAKDALVRAFQNTILPNQNDLPLKNPNQSWSADNPRMVSITMSWMNPTDVKDYDDVFNSWKRIFADVSSTNFGGMYALEVLTPTPSSDFNAVYDAMKRGEFDIGFGSISGEELMPLHFMEVLKSDNSSDFTLNWGPDTSEVSPDIIYDGKTWSYDALWQAGNSAALLNNEGALAAIKTVGNASTNASDHSATYTIDLSEFINGGATNFALVASTAGGNMESWSQTPSETAHLLTIDGSGRATITLGDTLNYDSHESTARDNATVILTLNFDVVVNGSRTSSTSTLSLQTYYGLTR